MYFPRACFSPGVQAKRRVKAVLALLLAVLFHRRSMTSSPYPMSDPVGIHCMYQASCLLVVCLTANPAQASRLCSHHLGPMIPSCCWRNVSIPMSPAQHSPTQRTAVNVQTPATPEEVPLVHPHQKMGHAGTEAILGAGSCNR